MIWNHPPSVLLLQWLARGSLKQNLLQAIRLWVELRQFYGAEPARLPLPDEFTYADWRDAFFSSSHPKSDVKPTRHDRQCPCAKVTAAWLFGDDLRWTQQDWETALHNPESAAVIKLRSHQLERALKVHDAWDANFHTMLVETRLFAVTRRTLSHDLKTLVDIHWLRQVGQSYQRVSEFPVHPSSADPFEDESQLTATNLDFLTQPDLAAIAYNLAHTVNGQRRFFVHLEYVVPLEKIDRVDEWQHQLRELWQHPTVPPIQLAYRGAGHATATSVIVYPVCIYYYQRGPYLCAWGTVPDTASSGASTPIDWRNYRLDRIEALTVLSWDTAQIDPLLTSAHRAGTLPVPEDVQTAMEDAWGFDYYQSAEQLLLRFDREWDDRYIQGTIRHSTFRPITHTKAGQLIRRHLLGEARETMLQVWRSRSTDDAYYQAWYRHHDPNVHQRLRAWRPRVEVLLPWDLRQRMMAEATAEWQMYHENNN